MNGLAPLHPIMWLVVDFLSFSANVFTQNLISFYFSASSLVRISRCGSVEVRIVSSCLWATKRRGSSVWGVDRAG